MNNILVVEDEAITAMDLSKRLQKIGYQVPGVASSGEDAVDLVQMLHPDLVLMDIMLKGDIDGIAAANKISLIHHVPVVFLTAYNDEDTFSRAKMTHPYGFLAKPINTRELQIAVELALFKHEMSAKTMLAEKRYHALMRYASCGIVICDKHGLIKEVNERAEKIFGNTNDKLIDADLRRFISTNDLNYLDLKLQKLILEHEANIGVNHIRQENGHKIDVDINSICVDVGSEEIIVFIINDITENNRLRAETILAGKLATIGTLTASIIHEINNPLCWVLTGLHQIKDSLKNANNFDHQRIIQLTDQSIEGVEKINQIVKGLKGFGRVDDADLKSTYIEEIVNSTIKMASPHTKNITKVDAEFDNNIPKLMLNQGKLQQVLLNLIVNAAQSFSDNGDYQHRAIKVITSYRGNTLSISVEDNGSGMAADVVEKIFEPFYTTKPVGIGTGLGLSICHDIITSLGGDIDVSSKINAGTKFIITLPIKVTASESETTSVSDPVQVNNKRILIIDDDKTASSVLKSILCKSNNVLAVNSGREALRLFTDAAEYFDVILADLNMPDINGSDIYRYLSTHRPELRDKMIFVTGGSCTPLLADFLAHTSNLRLDKPYTPQQLMNTIHELVDHSD